MNSMVVWRLVGEHNRLPTAYWDLAPSRFAPLASRSIWSTA